MNIKLKHDRKLRSTSDAWLLSVIIASISLGTTALQAQQLNDPTRPNDAKVAHANSSGEPAALHVEAIYRPESNQRRLAIVDGRLVHEGDRIANALIEEITASTVRYSRGGRTQLAQLNPAKLQVRHTSAAQFIATAHDQAEELP